MTEPGAQESTVVRVRGIPLRLWERTVQHNLELVREFNLITLSGYPTEHAEPPEQLIVALQQQYLGLSEEPTTLRRAALAAGLETEDVDYPAGPETGALCARLLDQLKEADAYCAAGVLMTLPTPPDQRAFLEWYLGEFVRQVQGASPTPWDGPTG